jgi:uridylate kinase
MNKTFVIKVGGSTLSTSIDTLFNFDQVTKIKESFMPLIQDGYKFVLVTGGGQLAREYQRMLRENNYSVYDQHYIGTCACNMNAIMLRAVFGDIAEEKIFAFGDFDDKNEVQFNKSVLVAGAGHPGPSSDWDATFLCNKVGGNAVISMKDIDGVYSADPKKDPSAQKLNKVDWNQYLEIIHNPEFQRPGGNLPVDPIASRLAQKNQIDFIILKGDDLNNFISCLKGETFSGTTISDRNN